MKNRSLQILKFIFGIVLLVFLLKEINLDIFIETFTKMNFLPILVIFSINVLGVFVNSYKWNILLPDAKFSSLVSASFISYFFSFFLPGQLLQEGVKGFYVKRTTAYTAHKIAASLIVDKILSLLALVFISLAGVFSSKKIFQFEIIVVFVLISIVLMALLLAFKSKFIYKALYSILATVKLGAPVAEKYLNKLMVAIKSWDEYALEKKFLILNFIFSIFYQFTTVLMCYLISRNLSLNITFLDWCWINGLLTFILLLPITVSGVGLREGSLLIILANYGFAKEAVISLSLVILIFNLLLGFVGCFEFLRKNEKLSACS